MKAVYEFTVTLPVDLDEDFTAEDARGWAFRRALEKDMVCHLQRWEYFPKACDCELVSVTIEGENPREKGDDDGQEYGHPGDVLAGRE